MVRLKIDLKTKDYRLETNFMLKLPQQIQNTQNR